MYFFQTLADLSDSADQHHDKIAISSEKPVVTGFIHNTQCVLCCKKPESVKLSVFI